MASSSPPAPGSQLSTELQFVPIAEDSASKRRLLLHFQVKNGKDVVVLSHPNTTSPLLFSSVDKGPKSPTIAQPSLGDTRGIEWTGESGSLLAKERQMRIDLEAKLYSKSLAFDELNKSTGLLQSQLKQHNDAQTHRDAYLAALRSQVYAQRTQIQKLKTEHAMAVKQLQADHEEELRRRRDFDHDQMDPTHNGEAASPTLPESQMDILQPPSSSSSSSSSSTITTTKPSRMESPDPSHEIDSSNLSPIALEAERTKLVSEELNSYKQKAQGEYKQLSSLLIKAQDEIAKLKGVGDIRQRLIIAATQKFKSLKPWLGVQIISGPPNGVRVVLVHAGSPAYQAGFRKGDIIETGMGMPTRTNSEFKLVISQVRTGDLLDFRIQRPNGSLELIKAYIVSRALPNYEQVIRLKRIAGGILVKGDDEFLRGLITSPRRTPQKLPSSSTATATTIREKEEQ